MISVSYLSLLIFSGDRLAETFRKRKVASAIATTGVGAAFLAFAVRLSVASVH